MASSFAEKVLKATALKAKGSEFSSPTRKASTSGSTSKAGSVSNSSSKYASRDSVPDTTIPAANLPAFVFSSGAGAASSGARQSASGRNRRKSGGDLVFIPGPPYAVREGSRLQESPYGKELAYERSPRRRRSSFATSLEKLSVAFDTPVGSPSPQVSTLGSSPPSLDFGDASGISSSPLVDDDGSSRSEHQDAGVPRDNHTPLSEEQHEWQPLQLGETGTNNSAISNSPTFSVPPPPVGEAFRSVLPENVSLMTNPLYPTILSPESSPSPPASAPHIDGFNIPAVGINLPNAPTDMSPTSNAEEILPLEFESTFLQKRKAAAATLRQKGTLASDPNSAASQAILKRRTQVWVAPGKVLSTVQKAKTRLSVLTYEITKKKRSFKTNCFDRFRRWLYERNRKRMMGKGTVVNKLWLASLKEMEVSYGSPMMVAFSFIRWVFLLNAFLAVFWLALIIIPFMAHPPKSFSWKLFWTTLGDKKAVKETFQGSNLEKTFVYYGGYTYTRREQRGWYRVDYMYAVMIAATFLFSFICVLIRISSTIMSRGDIAVAARLYPFSSLVFASWDFHLINADAASKLRRGIRMQLKEMLADVLHQEKNSSMRNRLMSVKRATALFFLWPLLMAANVAIVVQLVTKAEQVNHAFGSNYAQALFLSLLNIVTPMIIRILVDMENFRPASAERVVLMKLFCVRVLNLASLYYRLFMILEHTLQVRENKVVIEACQDGNRCYEGFTCCTTTNMTQWNICTDRDIQFCLPACTENAVGVQLLRLIVMTTLINNAYEIIYGFGYVWLTSGNKRQLYIEDMAIDVVYVQSLVWMGSCFSPMATILGFFANLLTWYGMRCALFRTCGPVEKAHSASRTESLTYGLLLLTLILSTIPATLNVMQRGSGFCGPIHDRISQYTVLTTYMKHAPQGLWLTIQWLTNPAVLLGVILLFVFGVVLLQSKLVQARQFLALTKHEMGMQRREASERLTRVRENPPRPQNGTGAVGPDAKAGLPPNPLRRLSAPAEVHSSVGQVEAVNIPTETNFRRGENIGSLRMAGYDTGKFLFSLANERQEPPSSDQGLSSVTKTTRRRSRQVRDQTPRPSLLREEKSRQAPRTSRQRASVIYTLVEKVCIICGMQRPHTGRRSRTSLSADDSFNIVSEDEGREPVALIRGFKVPPDAKVVESAPSIWSVLTPLSGSSIWGSLSSEPVNTARTSISQSGPGGGSDAMVTARTSLSSTDGWPLDSSIRGGLSAASTISKFWTESGSQEHQPSLPQVKSAEMQNAATPPSRSRTSLSNSTAQLGLMPSVGSSTFSRSSGSLHAETTRKLSVRSSLITASEPEKIISSIGDTSVLWWRRLLGRSKRKSALRRLSRMSVIAGSGTSPARSGSGHVSPLTAANSVKQWLARTIESSTSRSHPRSPLESGRESLSTPKGRSSLDTGVA